MKCSGSFLSGWMHAARLPSCRSRARGAGALLVLFCGITAACRSEPDVSAEPATTTSEKGGTDGIGGGAGNTAGGSEPSGEDGVPGSGGAADSGDGPASMEAGTGGPGGTSLPDGVCHTNADCKTKEFCNFGIKACAISSIGGRNQGECRARPDPAECPEDCPGHRRGDEIVRGACGCDGVVYCNACLANAAGTDTTPNWEDFCPEGGL